VDPEYIQDLFAAFYADGVMFGLLSDGRIYLKADAATAPEFEREGCAPFEYATKTGRRAIMSYWRLPERLYDDPDALAQWARTALLVAQRRAAAKPKARAKKRVKVKRPASRRRRR
jgi:DNA transformation protein and related proteins